MSITGDMVKYSRLALGLRGYLRNPLTLEQSQQRIAERLRDREKNFLSLVQKGVYQNPKSPFLKLLEVAGCQFGDIEAGVNQDGIEATLQKLMEAGVYIDWEEFKGRKEVVRGGRHFQFKERDFDTPYLPVYYQKQSSGSRSPGTRTTFDLTNVLEKSYYEPVMLAAHNARGLPVGLWYPVLPASTGISNMIRYWKVGQPVFRWFSPVDENQAHSSLTHRLAMRYIISGGRLWGARLPWPEYVGYEEAVKVARWMAETKQRYGGCVFCGYVSLAARVCQAAVENGLDIAGSHFFSGGEPLTPAKRRQIEAAGALVTPKYAISEVGRVGCGCADGSTSDDIHLYHDSTALIQRRRKVEPSGIEVDAFVFTPLLPSTPKILLNMESDDYGVMETRKCNCLFGEMGFNTHLHHVRSYAKLTGSGMTIVGTDMVRILEEVLPAKYGGAATDYQLLEEEDSQGRTRLSLIINPRVGEVDEEEVINTVLAELQRVPHPGQLTAGVWAQMKLLRVKRMPPIPRVGKVWTLQLMKTE